MDFELFELCQNNANFKKILFLIDKGANVNSHFKDYLYNCPLYTSIYNNNYDLIKLLIDKGCDVNISCSIEFTPLSIAILSIKDEIDKYKIVKLLLDHGSNPEKTFLMIKKCRNIFWERDTKIISDYLKHFYSKL